MRRDDDKDTKLPIIQYWHSPDVPADVAELIASVAEKNPDLHHLVFNEASAEEFIGEHFGAREVEAFRACAVPAMQADYLRYCAVFALGGIYVDADYRCVQCFSPLVARVDEGLLFKRPSGVLFNGLFLFKVLRHPLLRLVLDVVTSNIERRGSDGIWWLSGPGMLTTLTELRRLGSFRATRQAAAERGFARQVEGIIQAIGDYERVREAFKGIHVVRYNAETDCIEAPEVPPLYKKGNTHWPRWEGRGEAIFRKPRSIPAQDEGDLIGLPLVQYWHSTEIPPDIGEMLETFADQNPDLRHQVFDESSAESFIAEHLTGREVAAFRACAVPAMQADYFRYCAGLVLGGICCDADYFCARPFRPLIEEADHGLLFQTPNGTVHNGFFVFTAPRPPLLRLALDVATANIERRAQEQVWWITGPGVLTILHALSEHGSFEATQQGAAERGVEAQAAAAIAAVGDYARVTEAFAGVRILEFDVARMWLGKPETEPPYKQTDAHWTNWQKSGRTIFR